MDAPFLNELAPPYTFAPQEMVVDGEMPDVDDDAAERKVITLLEIT